MTPYFPLSGNTDSEFGACPSSLRLSVRSLFRYRRSLEADFPQNTEVVRRPLRYSQAIDWRQPSKDVVSKRMMTNPRVHVCEKHSGN